MRTYQETIDFLYEKLPMFSRIGAVAYKPNLSNIQKICAALNNPHLKFKSIHVGGTNGKGSVCNMLASIMQTSGYKVGLYTSPHIYDFKERIRINGNYINTVWLVEFVEKIEPLIEKLKPSFFEITVAMAFAYFADNQVDIAIIEVGMGGLLDSTNIILPELSVITNISEDHVPLLGNNLVEIANQKAGIIKPEIPILIGEKNLSPEVDFVFKKTAINQYAPLSYVLDYVESIDFVSEKKDTRKYAILNKLNKNIIRIETDLIADYQQKNIKTVAAVCYLLQNKGWKISASHIEQGIINVKKNTSFYGRFEIVQQKPMIILDVSHNYAGIEQTLNQLKQYSHKQLHIVIGFVKDKNIENIFTLLPPNARYYFTQANIERALPVSKLYQYGVLFALNGKPFDSVEMAFEQAKMNAHEEDIILVIGSFFILSELKIKPTN